MRSRRGAPGPPVAAGQEPRTLGSFVSIALGDRPPPSTLATPSAAESARFRPHELPLSRCPRAARARDVRGGCASHHPAQGAEAARDRPRGHGRAGLGRRARPAGSVHLLRGPGHRRPHEDHGQRRQLPGRVRRAGGGLHRRGRGGPFRCEGRVGGHRRGQRPQQLGLGQRRLPVDGRRRDLAARRPLGEPCHRAHRRAPEGSRGGLGRRGGRPLDDRRRARTLQDQRRRQDLEGRAHRQRSPGREGGRGRRRPRSREPRRRVRGALRAAAHAVVVHIGAGAHGRTGPGRHLQEQRRRRHLEAPRAGAARGHRPHRPRRLQEGPAHRLRDRAERRGGDEQHRRRAEPPGRGVPVGGRAARPGCARAR